MDVDIKCEDMKLKYMRNCVLLTLVIIFINLRVIINETQINLTQGNSTLLKSMALFNKDDNNDGPPIITKSPECITPSAFDLSSRRSSAKVGIFNLISTILL